MPENSSFNQQVSSDNPKGRLPQLYGGVGISRRPPRGILIVQLKKFRPNGGRYLEIVSGLVTKVATYGGKKFLDIEHAKGSSRPNVAGLIC